MDNLTWVYKMSNTFKHNDNSNFRYTTAGRKAESVRYSSRTGRGRCAYNCRSTDRINHQNRFRNSPGTYSYRFCRPQMDDWRTACRRYLTGSQSLLLIKFSDLRSKIGVAGQLQLDNPPLLDYPFFAPAQSGAGIGILKLLGASRFHAVFLCAKSQFFIMSDWAGSRKTGWFRVTSMPTCSVRRHNWHCAAGFNNLKLGVNHD